MRIRAHFDVFFFVFFFSLLFALLPVFDLYGLFRTCALPVCRYPLVVFHLSVYLLWQHVFNYFGMGTAGLDELGKDFSICGSHQGIFAFGNGTMRWKHKRPSMAYHLLFNPFYSLACLCGYVVSTICLIWALVAVILIFLDIALISRRCCLASQGTLMSQLAYLGSLEMFLDSAINMKVDEKRMMSTWLPTWTLSDSRPPTLFFSLCSSFVSSSATIQLKKERKKHMFVPA